jgi:hypothetical protein
MVFMFFTTHVSSWCVYIRSDVPLRTLRALVPIVIDGCNGIYTMVLVKIGVHYLITPGIRLLDGNIGDLPPLGGRAATIDTISDHVIRAGSQPDHGNATARCDVDSNRLGGTGRDCCVFLTADAHRVCQGDPRERLEL